MYGARRKTNTAAMNQRKPPQPIGGSLPRWAAAFCIVWLLAGCREESRKPLELSATAVWVGPSPTRKSTSTPTATLPPSEAPALTPTTGPSESVVQGTKADVWDAPENEGQYWNLQTQLILGEKVLVIDRSGDWSRIAAVEQPSKKDPRGYPGWVRSEFLAPGWPAAEKYAVVMKARTHLSPEPGGQPGMLIYLDTRLPVEKEQGDWVQVRLPDGAGGWLPLGDARLTGDLSQVVPADGLFALAESLIGTPYKWGGTVSDSQDCSGLPYRLFHAYGILMSRDADDQALEGEFVDRYSVRKGDLIFAATTSGGEVTHEVVYWGNDTVLDADIVRGVILRPMSDFFVNYYWITARRFLS
jgi:cell wall-associated NlpC family hydrolase